MISARLVFIVDVDQQTVLDKKVWFDVLDTKEPPNGNVEVYLVRLLWS